MPAILEQVDRHVLDQKLVLHHQHHGWALARSFSRQESAPALEEDFKTVRRRVAVQ
jgi:hypothetical protein